VGSRILPLSFYLRDDVVTIARELVGKALFSSIDGVFTGGIITETEAYRGPEDRASHAYNNRRTARTEVMFCEGGISYVYLCYGIHCLLNVVTNTKNIPHAILIRGLHPIEGLKQMEERRKTKKNLCKGPGSVCQALGINRSHNGLSLQTPPLWIEDRGYKNDHIEVGPRIGIDYAGEDARLPYRFFLKDGLV